VFVFLGGGVYRLSCSLCFHCGNRIVHPFAHSSIHGWCHGGRGLTSAPGGASASGHARGRRGPSSFSHEPQHGHAVHRHGEVPLHRTHTGMSGMLLHTASVSRCIKRVCVCVSRSEACFCENGHMLVWGRVNVHECIGAGVCGKVSACV